MNAKTQTPKSQHTPGLIRWDISREDHVLVRCIVARAKRNGLQSPDLDMDLTAVHLNDSPLDLAAFANGDDSDFTHDIVGIVRHLDRTTGKLGDCFSPRFARHAKAEQGDA